MKTIFVIQDVKTKEYFYEYQVCHGFISNIEEAKKYLIKEDALNELHDSWVTDCFLGRLIEVKEYHVFNE